MSKFWGRDIWDFFHNSNKTSVLVELQEIMVKFEQVRFLFLDICYNRNVPSRKKTKVEIHFTFHVATAQRNIKKRKFTSNGMFKITVIP